MLNLMDRCVLHSDEQIRCNHVSYVSIVHCFWRNKAEMELELWNNYECSYVEQIYGVKNLKWSRFSNFHFLIRCGNVDKNSMANRSKISSFIRANVFYWMGFDVKQIWLILAWIQMNQLYCAAFIAFFGWFHGKLDSFVNFDWNDWILIILSAFQNNKWYWSR